MKLGTCNIFYWQVAYLFIVYSLFFSFFSLSPVINKCDLKNYISKLLFLNGT